MDYLDGIAWVRFVTECLNEMLSGVNIFRRRRTIVVIRNRWAFAGQPHRQPYVPRKRLCIANDNGLD